MLGALMSGARPLESALVSEGSVQLPRESSELSESSGYDPLIRAVLRRVE